MIQLGSVTFGTDPVGYEPSVPSEPEFGFAGIFSGVPVSVTYNYEGGALNLEYNYHNHDVSVFGNLDFLGSHHMELTQMADYYTHHWNYVLSAENPDICCRAVTGLHTHPNYTIQFALEYTYMVN